MAFREVAMFEVKEVIRLFGEGVPKKAIARVVGVDPKTVRSYVAAAEGLGLAGLLDDDGLARLLRELRIDVVERPRGEAWRRCEEHRDAIKKRLADSVKLTKVRKLLKRRSVFVPCTGIPLRHPASLAPFATNATIGLKPTQRRSASGQST